MKNCWNEERHVADQCNDGGKDLLHVDNKLIPISPGQLIQEHLSSTAHVKEDTPTFKILDTDW